MKLVNQDADGAGEICLWGRSIFMGYLNKEDKTCECIDADGWLHTGDIGRLDADGFLYITGRIKGVGRSGGTRQVRGCSGGTRHCHCRSHAPRAVDSWAPGCRHLERRRFGLLSCGVDTAVTPTYEDDAQRG